MRDYRDYNDRQDFREQRRQDFHARWEARRGRRHGTFGFILVVIGIVMLAYLFGWHYFPNHIIWPCILIAVGIFSGIRHRFTNFFSFVLIAIGAVNLIPRFQIGNVWSSELAVPVLFIIGGLIVVFKPRKKKCYPSRDHVVTSTNPEDLLNIDVTFGGRKAIVTSKQFKGGNVSVAFAGAEINLMQADSTEQMELNMKVSFGGVEVIVPSHWEVQIDMQPTFGNVEDNRMIRTPAPGETRRTLVLRGTCSFGNVELKSY